MDSYHQIIKNGEDGEYILRDYVWDAGDAVSIAEREQANCGEGQYITIRVIPV